MGVEDFLKDFDEQNQKIKEAKQKEEAAKQKLKVENEKYLTDFQEYYQSQLIPELKRIGGKLGSKFELTYENEPNAAQGSYFYKTVLIPKFEHFIKKIDIQIIAEGSRRLITLSGTAYGSDNKNLNRDGLVRFQDVFEAFQRIQLEDEITAILNSLFLRK